MPLALSTGLALPVAQGGSDDSPVIGDSPSDAYPLAVDLIAYWNLDEESGTRLDSHTGGYHLTSNNNPLAADGVGAGQRAAEFVSADQKSLSRPMTDELLLAASPWECTFHYRSPAANQSVLRTIIDCRNNANANGGWELRIGSNSDRIQFLFTNDGYSTSTSVGNTSFQATGTSTWNFVRVGWDGTNGFIQVNSATMTTGAGTFAAMLLAKDFNIGQTTIGPNWLDGRVQGCGLWARNLTNAEWLFLKNSNIASRLYTELSSFTG